MLSRRDSETRGCGCFHNWHKANDIEEMTLRQRVVKTCCILTDVKSVVGSARVISACKNVCIITTRVDAIAVAALSAVLVRSLYRNGSTYRQALSLPDYLDVLLLLISNNVRKFDGITLHEGVKYTHNIVHRKTVDKYSE